MNKTVFEKWEELCKAASFSDSVIIGEYYLSSVTKTKLYFGMNQSIQYMYIEFSKEYLVNIDIPEFKGLDISISNESSIDCNKSYVKIKNNSNNEELFIALSCSLYDALVSTTDYPSAFLGFKNVLKEYREFFTNQDYKISLKEEQGLCAELCAVKDLIVRKGEDIISFWQGPSKNKRDFVFKESALEIKSTLSQIDSSISISNENQLDSSIPDGLVGLYLKVYIFEQDINGFNVITCAKDVLASLTNNRNRALFISNMLRMKIDIDSFKPRYSFTLQSTKQYKVFDSFPAIIKNNLPFGVFSVKYRVRLDALKNYEIGLEDLYEQL